MLKSPQGKGQLRPSSIHAAHGVTLRDASQAGSHQLPSLTHGPGLGLGAGWVGGSRRKARRQDHWDIHQTAHLLQPVPKSAWVIKLQTAELQNGPFWIFYDNRTFPLINTNNKLNLPEGGTSLESRAWISPNHKRLWALQFKAFLLHFGPWSPPCLL